MKKIFNNIEKIAVEIQNDIFKNYDNFKNTNTIINHCETIIKKHLNNSAKAIVSITDKKILELNTNNKYIVTYVPIDTPSLLDSNFSLGSIFSIYDTKIDIDNLQSVCYITYGPTFQLVYATKDDGVGYYDYENNTFIKQGILTLNKKGKINSTGGDRTTWSDKHKEDMQYFFDNGYRLRFSNSLCLDTHQILFKKGGIYSNPTTKQDPKGLINLVFEAYPIAFVIIKANGKAIDSKIDILNKPYKTLEDKTPFYFGSEEEISYII